MAIIHHTTMSPGKLELLTAWLPAQPWYLPTGREPELVKAGGFRLDDPEGEVGIEFMVVTDGSGDRVTAYHVPMTYRGREFAPASGGLIGTSEHGVLGRRWIYDGTHDPVLVAQLAALVQGAAEPQAQSLSGTPDPTVTGGRPVADGAPLIAGAAVSVSDAAGTDLRVETARADGAPAGQLTVRISRVLTPADSDAEPPCVLAGWRLPDGTKVRGVLAAARYATRTA
jgi:hypothetical protein